VQDAAIDLKKDAKKIPTSSATRPASKSRSTSRRSSGITRSSPARARRTSRSASRDPQGPHPQAPRLLLSGRDCSRDCPDGPAALYNFCQFDDRARPRAARRCSSMSAAQNTDLIIVEPNSAWTRNIRSAAIAHRSAVRSFKLSFAKAENLKRRRRGEQVRPADLPGDAARVRRFGWPRFSAPSLSTLESRDVRAQEGHRARNAFRLPGLQKYLENNLTYEGREVRALLQLLPSATINAPQFTENVLSFAAAYGLAPAGPRAGKIKASAAYDSSWPVSPPGTKQPVFRRGPQRRCSSPGRSPGSATGLDKQALGGGDPARRPTGPPRVIDEAKQGTRKDLRRRHQTNTGRAPPDRHSTAS